MVGQRAGQRASGWADGRFMTLVRGARGRPQVVDAITLEDVRCVLLRPVPTGSVLENDVVVDGTARCDVESTVLVRSADRRTEGYVVQEGSNKLVVGLVGDAVHRLHFAGDGSEGSGQWMLYRCDRHCCCCHDPRHRAHPPTRPSACPPARLPAHPPVRPSACPPVRLPVRLPA